MLIQCNLGKKLKTTHLFSFWEWLCCKKNKSTLKTRQSQNKGFTLLEVLIALSVIAISLTALLKSISSTIHNTQRVHEKLTSHFIALQGAYLTQLGLLKIGAAESTQTTEMFNQKWYWRVEIQNTPIPGVKALKIKVSRSQGGPFQEALIAYKRL